MKLCHVTFFGQKLKVISNKNKKNSLLFNLKVNKLLLNLYKSDKDI